MRSAADPERVVSLVPSATDWILALDEADRLVARTDHDDDPRLAHLPSLGTTTPSTEAVLALEPDLVLLMADPGAQRLARSLERHGVAHAILDPRTIADVAAVARRIGGWFGDPAAAEVLANRFERRFDAVRSRAGAGPRPTIFYALWTDPPRTAGAGTFVGQIIEAAGGRAAFPELDDGWPEVALEALVRRDPDVLVVPDGAVEGDALARLRTMPGWSGLGAVREQRVIEVDGALFERPGPRVVEAAERLADALRASGAS